MKKLIYLLVLTFGSTLTAQVQTPQSSPSAKTHQKVGLTELSVEYSRPSMRGRVIMGELVPYGAIWRTGANKNTVISFSDAVTFGDQEISAGSYALYTRPGKDQWEVFFYSSTDNWGTPDLWEASKVAAAIEVIPTIGNDIETFSIWFSNVHNNGAILNLAWADTRIALPFGVPTKTKVIESIKKELKKNPNRRTLEKKADDYNNAAVYYLEEGLDLNQAKGWMEKAIEGIDDDYGYFRQYSLILKGLNDVKGAISAAKQSLVLAEKAGNLDYVRLNKEAIQNWSK